MKPTSDPWGGILSFRYEEMPGGKFFGEGAGGKILLRGQFAEHLKKDPPAIRNGVRTQEKRPVEDGRFPQSVEMMERTQFQDKRSKIVN